MADKASFFAWKKNGFRLTVEDHFIAPKASAEGACILKEVGYYGACMMGYYD